MIGGKDSTSSDLSTVEVLGENSCSVPDLPEARSDHGSFLTEWGALAVCGGSWKTMANQGKPWSSDCLVLNSTTKQWDRRILGGVLDDEVRGVFNMEVGTYLVHPASSSFLPSGWKLPYLSKRARGSEVLP